MMLEDIQDARNAVKPANDTFCNWNEAELRAAMEKEAKAVRMNNRNLVYRNNGAAFTGKTDGTHVACKNAMREIGRPCTRRELELALDVQRHTVQRYIRALVHNNEITTDRNEAGEIVYVLVAGYSQKELDL